MELAALLAGALLVAFSAGAAGFADALIASAIWLQLYPPVEAVPLIFLVGIVVHAGSLAVFRRHLDRRRLLPFIAAGAAGVPFGVWALERADPAPFRWAVGLALIVICSLQLAAYLRRPAAVRAALRMQGPVSGWAAGWRDQGAKGRAADGLVGLVSGVLGGLAGLSGVLPTLWSGVRGGSPDEQRAVYQPFILTMHALALALLLGWGDLPGVVWERFAYCLPVVLVGLALGFAVYRRLDQRTFRVVVSVILLAAGVALLAR